jgi:putative glutamine amidotransferase
VTGPIVGVTLGAGDRPGRRSIREDYLRSVEQAGGVPLLLPPVSPGDAAHLLERLDGVLLSGGGDVDPVLYGKKPHPRLGRVDRRRDDFELALARAALERDLPILAICRGQQLLNVATGGTLLQDIPSDLVGASEHDAPGGRRRRSHVVELLPHTRLRAILGRDTVAVNSFHHQAVDRLGRGLAAAGRCPEDGVVEALEAGDRRFVVAVQWHPESFWDQPVSFQALFDAHVEACRP